jgi:hypothetical protein
MASQVNGAHVRPFQEAHQFCLNKPEIKFTSEEFKDRLVQNCIRAVLREQVGVQRPESGS